MPEQKDTKQEFPGAPILKSPTGEERVEGPRVRFVWEPVRDARHYRLQVAADTAFEEVVLDEVVGTETEFATRDAVPSDGNTYFWRVLVQTGEGWSRGERVESFVSGTAEDVEAVGDDEKRRPEEQEEYGPLGGLFGTAVDEAATEALGTEEDRARLARERELGVAEEGIEAGQILAIVAAITVAVIIIISVLFFWVDIVARTARDAAVAVAQYPELQNVEMEAERRLTEYEAVDPQAGIYRIPIERAMELMLLEQYAADEELIELDLDERVVVEEGAAGEPGEGEND